MHTDSPENFSKTNTTCNLRRTHELSWLSTKAKALITVLLSQFGAVRHEIVIYENSTKQFKNLTTFSSVAGGSNENMHLSQSLWLPTAPYALLNCMAQKGGKGSHHSPSSS